MPPPPMVVDAWWLDSLISACGATSSRSSFSCPPPPATLSKGLVKTCHLWTVLWRRESVYMAVPSSFCLLFSSFSPSTIKLHSFEHPAIVSNTHSYPSPPIFTFNLPTFKPNQNQTNLPTSKCNSSPSSLLPPWPPSPPLLSMFKQRQSCISSFADEYSNRTVTVYACSTSSGIAKPTVAPTKVIASTGVAPTPTGQPQFTGAASMNAPALGLIVAGGLALVCFNVAVVGGPR